MLSRGWLVLLLAGTLASAEHRQFVVVSTTDLHGNLFPIDYATNRSDERGLAKAAAVIGRIRQEGSPVLLIDTGDTVAGSLMAHHQAAFQPQAANVMMAAMNGLRYDAMVVGNHEYDFGWTYLEGAKRTARFPWLAANVSFKGSERTVFEPYVVVAAGVVRVGVLGLTTTAMVNWDNPEQYLGKFEYRDPKTEAARWVKVLREREGVDVVVAAVHMGLEEDPASGRRMPGQLPGENQALAIAKEVSGIDLVLMGHSHREVKGLEANQVLLVQPAAWGRSVARVDLTVEQRGGRWRVVSKTARTVTVDGVEPETAFADRASEEHAATQKWLAEVVGRSESELRAGPERFEDAPLLDMVHRVQMEAGKADVSLAESLNPTARIPKGPVTVRDVFGLYGIEKKIVTLEVTGRQLREALEHSAGYFRGVVDGKGPEAWVDPEAASYNYYVAEGVTYDLDVSRPVGQRIVNLRWQGEELGDEARFRLATNHYLANGAAGYEMFLGAKVLWRSEKDLREMLVDWLRRQTPVSWKANGNWRLLPVTTKISPSREIVQGHDASGFPMISWEVLPRPVLLFIGGILATVSIVCAWSCRAFPIKLMALAREWASGEHDWMGVTLMGLLTVGGYAFAFALGAVAFQVLVSCRPEKLVLEGSRLVYDPGSALAVMGPGDPYDWVVFWGMLRGDMQLEVRKDQFGGAEVRRYAGKNRDRTYVLVRAGDRSWRVGQFLKRSDQHWLVEVLEEWKRRG